MKIQSVKGTRDLYPEDYAPILHIFDAWRATSLRHGFAEFEGPTLEPLELYVRKSGDEIVSQLFSLKDRADRDLAMRPELTPTLARMVAARVNSLQRPIKWFSIPRLYRGERPQRGRLREFYQWNADVIGVEDEIADAEVIAVAIEALAALGLKSSDVVVRISDRRLVAAVFDGAGLSDELRAAAYGLLDKAADMPPEIFAEKWTAALGDRLDPGRLRGLLDARDLEQVAERAAAAGASRAAVEAIVASDHRMMRCLQALGVADYCRFDVSVVRGLAYYTGPVFEGYDRGGKERAIFGGGRYDHLLASVGGGSVPAVGFGMGDVVLHLMLEERGLLPPARAGLDAFVIDGAAASFDAALSAVAQLRRAGRRVDLDYKRRPVGKQMATAASREAAFAVLVSPDKWGDGIVSVKDMAGGAKADVPFERLLREPVERWLAS